MKRLTLAFSNLFFSVLLQCLFSNQRLTNTSAVRKFIKYSLGVLVAPVYANVISLYGERYGLAIGDGLDEAQRLTQKSISTVVDCGTGTGYVSEVVGRRFSSAQVVSIDAVMAMLKQARARLENAALCAQLVCADTSALPIRSGSVDLVVAQNTTPFIREFSRLVAPGGVLLFADSSATLPVRSAIKAFERTGLFQHVYGRRAKSGFFVMGVRNDREGAS